MFFYLILLNCIWDFICSISILLDYSILSKIHTNIWIDNKNKKNKAAKHLMAYLILYWGFMRFFGLIFNLKNLIIFSYIFDGFLGRPRPLLLVPEVPGGEIGIGTTAAGATKPE